MANTRSANRKPQRKKIIEQEEAHRHDNRRNKEVPRTTMIRWIGLPGVSERLHIPSDQNSRGPLQVPVCTNQKKWRSVK